MLGAQIEADDRIWRRVEVFGCLCLERKYVDPRQQVVPFDVDEVLFEAEGFQSAAPDMFTEEVFIKRMAFPTRFVPGEVVLGAIEAISGGLFLRSDPRPYFLD
ncbi:unnamed protein product [Tilletia controversa]|uniref:Uncharacterized protein n=1 Tax=Tilletia controversa TaxID=13291 RepID=A0A8X7MYN2_9BASI|nr:hypothetical protein A4X06_0g1302 [Tilletia controversa]CAD6953090.1 unnamed protein product [Tilletia controversa]